MDNFSRLNLLLTRQDFNSADSVANILPLYAECMAGVGGAVVVLSNLSDGVSRIFLGAFAGQLGLSDYSKEDSIWEKAILARIIPEDRDEKYLAELRFFNYVNKQSRENRRLFYLVSKLRFLSHDGRIVNAMHRMYYIYDHAAETVHYALCIYEPMWADFAGRSIVVNAMNGATQALTEDIADVRVLSKRELHVLSLIEQGKSSAEIADILSISIHTVSRHRQEILAKLHVKNSVEACHMAKALGLIN